MHELGLTRRMLDVVLQRAADGGAGRVTEVQLEVGSESDVAPASLEFYWPQVSRGTAAEGARLAFSEAEDPWAFRVTSIDVEMTAPSTEGP
jgi:hydrogenase nickel incorporation protein HypA/HybF